MKKQESSLPIATGEFTASHSSILTQVSVTSEDGNDTYAYEFRGKWQDVIIGMNIIRNGRFLLEPTDDGGMKFTFTVG
jgi:hypothetical protein